MLTPARTRRSRRRSTERKFQLESLEIRALMAGLAEAETLCHEAQHELDPVLANDPWLRESGVDFVCSEAPTTPEVFDVIAETQHADDFEADQWWAHAEQMLQQEIQEFCGDDPECGEGIELERPVTAPVDDGELPSAELIVVGNDFHEPIVFDATSNQTNVEFDPEMQCNEFYGCGTAIYEAEQNRLDTTPNENCDDVFVGCGTAIYEATTTEQRNDAKDDEAAVETCDPIFVGCGTAIYEAEQDRTETPPTEECDPVFIGCGTAIYEATTNQQQNTKEDGEPASEMCGPIFPACGTAIYEAAELWEAEDDSCRYLETCGIIADNVGNNNANPAPPAADPEPLKHGQVLSDGTIVHLMEDGTPLFLCGPQWAEPGPCEPIPFAGNNGGKCDANPAPQAAQPQGEKAFVNGRWGQWFEINGTRTFRSDDGKYAEVHDPNKKTKVTVTRDDSGKPAQVKIENQAANPQWTTITGTLNPDGTVKVERVHLPDGRSLKPIDDNANQIFSADGKSNYLHIDGTKLANATGNERIEIAKSIAQSIIDFKGWDQSRHMAITQFLLDTFKANLFDAMNITVDSEGKIRVIYSDDNGRQRIDTARFTDRATKFHDDPAEALVVSGPVTVNIDGSVDNSQAGRRSREYREDGSRLKWHLLPGSDEGTKVQVHFAYRTSYYLEGDWRAPIISTVDVIPSNEPGFFSHAGAVLLDVPGLGHLLKGLGWVGNKGYNVVAGSGQYIIGEVCDSAVYRVEGLAGMHRGYCSDDQDYLDELKIIKRDEEELRRLNDAVYDMRIAALKADGITRDTAPSPREYDDMVYGPITDAEYIRALKNEVGPGTYGRQLAHRAAQTDGAECVGYVIAGTTVQVIEGATQAIPTLLVFGGLSWMTTPANVAGVYGLEVYSACVINTVNTARVVSIGVQGYAATVGTIDTANNVYRLFDDGFGNGNVYTIVDTLGQIIVDGYQMGKSYQMFNEYTRPTLFDDWNVWMYDLNTSYLRWKHPNGVAPEHHVKFGQMAANDGFIYIVRDCNPASLPYQSMDGYCTKPVTCKAKTAKHGPNAGLVVDPTHPVQVRYWEAALRNAANDPVKQQQIQKDRENAVEAWEGFKKKQLGKDGYTRNDEDGTILLNGERIYGDYDLHGVYQLVDNEVVPFGDGKKDSVSEQIGEGNKKRINKDLVGPDAPDSKKPVKHGPQDEWANDGKSFDAPATAYTPFGSIYLPDGPSMHKFYDFFQIPWQYDVPAPKTSGN